MMSTQKCSAFQSYLYSSICKDTSRPHLRAVLVHRFPSRRHDKLTAGICIAYISRTWTIVSLKLSTQHTRLHSIQVHNACIVDFKANVEVVCTTSNNCVEH